MRVFKRDNGWTCTNNKTCATCALSLFFPQQHDCKIPQTASHLGRCLFKFHAVYLPRNIPVLNLLKSVWLLIILIPIQILTSILFYHIYHFRPSLFPTCPHVSHCPLYTAYSLPSLTKAASICTYK